MLTTVQALLEFQLERDLLRGSQAEGTGYGGAGLFRMKPEN
jgi:hypothetical protein